MNAFEGLLAAVEAGLSRDLEKLSLVQSCTIFMRLHVLSIVWQIEEIVAQR